MNEMDLVRDFGETLGRKSVEPTATLTRRIEASMTQGDWPSGLLGYLTARRVHKRPSLRIAISIGAVATAVATAVALLPSDQLTRHSVAVPTTTNLTARSILLAAAKESSMTSFSPPAASSFVYTEFVQTNRGLSTGTTEMWLSVDGSKDGLVGQTVDMTQFAEHFKEGKVPGAPPVPSSVGGKHFFPYPIKRCPSTDRFESGDFETRDVESGDCAPPGYAAQAPTDAAAMRAYLFRGEHGGQANRQAGKRQAWTRAFGLLPPRLLAPHSRTALFETLAEMSGMTVEQNVTLTALPDRRGVAVVSPPMAEGLSLQLVFDADDHDYLGCRLVATRTFRPQPDVPPIPAGTELSSIAILRTGVVAEAGLRQDGTRPTSTSPQHVMGGDTTISYGTFTPWSPEMISELMT